MGGPAQVTVRVPAKINLELRVGPLREDGYHELATVFHAVSLYDDLTVEPAGRTTIEIEGPQAGLVPTDRGNLAVRAVELLAERTGIEAAVRMHLRKGIPVAGGMAGGSADAAAALVACDALWGTGLTRDDLGELAADLGSDVPFALLGGTAVGTGRGERLTPALARAELTWVLALAEGGLSTPDVFRELDRLRGDRPQGPPRVSDDLMQGLRSGDSAHIGAALHNDMQRAALSLEPDLERVLAVGTDAGAIGGLVSGSGPTVAFLARDLESSLDVAVALTASGLVRDVRRATGPVPGARVVEPVRG